MTPQSYEEEKESTAGGAPHLAPQLGQSIDKPSMPVVDLMFQFEVELGGEAVLFCRRRFDQLDSCGRFDAFLPPLVALDGPLAQVMFEHLQLVLELLDLVTRFHFHSFEPSLRLGGGFGGGLLTCSHFSDSIIAILADPSHHFIIPL